MKIGITFDIKEHYGFDQLDLSYTDFQTMADVTFAKHTLEKLGNDVLLIGNLFSLTDFLQEKNSVDMIFNLSWGYKGRNRESLIPAVLESYHIPYTGTDAYGCSLCLDKCQVKLIAKHLGIPTPNFHVINYVDEEPQLSFPLILKPNAQGTGMGVTLVENNSEYKLTVEKLLSEYGAPILCEY